MNFESDPRTLSFSIVRSLPETITESYLNQSAGEAFCEFYRKILDIKKNQEDALDMKKEDLRIFDFSKNEYEIDLPETKIELPRHKPIPKERPLTKWQKFAKDNGVNKKKRSRMVFDDALQDWIPRWGARSVKKLENQRNIIMEDDGTGDPFAKRDAEKSIKRDQQRIRESKNDLNRQVAEEKGNKASKGKFEKRDPGEKRPGDIRREAKKERIGKEMAIGLIY